MKMRQELKDLQFFLLLHRIQEQMNKKQWLTAMAPRPVSEKQIQDRITYLINVPEIYLTKAYLIQLRQALEQIKSYADCRLIKLQAAVKKEIRVKEIQSLTIPQVIKIGKKDNQIYQLIWEIEQLNDQRITKKIKWLQFVAEQIKKTYNISNPDTNFNMNWWSKISSFFSSSESCKKQDKQDNKPKANLKND